MIRLISILLFCLPAFAGTQILDTITNPDGSLFSGTLTITGPRQTTASGSTTISGVFKKDITITAGALDITLEANDVLVPADTSYGARYQSRNGVSRFEYWIVPTSATPLKIPDITVSTIPTPALSFAISQISGIGAVAGDLMNFSTSWGRLPIGDTNGQVLTVDLSLPRKLKWATGAGGDLGFTPANVANNLSDLASASTARTNLGLGTAATSAASAFESPLTFNSPLGRTVDAISIQVANTSQAGYLAAADWSTFNGKQAALGFTPPPNTLTLSVTNPITGGGSLAANRTFGCATCVTSAAALTADAMIVGAGSQGVAVSNVTKATGQPLTSPDGFSTSGGLGPYFMDIGGDTSGFLRLKANANSVSMVTATFPASDGTVMYTATGVTAAQMPALTGDVTSSAGAVATTVGKINGVSMAGLATGLVKNTTSTGAPSIAVAADLPAHASRHQNGGNDEVGTATPGANAVPKAGSDGRLDAGFLQFIGGGQIPLSGLEFKRAFSGNLTNGTNDIYAAPTLKRAYIKSFQAFNSTGGSIIASISLKSGGTYHRLTSNQTVTTLSTAALAPAIVLEPGESIAVVTDVTGLNVWFRIEEYDSSVPMYSPRLLSVSSGDNTLYTVPASKSAIILGSPTGPAGLGAVFASNATGGTRTYKYYVVSSGGATGASNQTAGATFLTNTAINTQQFGTMATGDFIVYNTDAATAGQVVWTVVIEKNL